MASIRGGQGLGEAFRALALGCPTRAARWASFSRAIPAESQLFTPPMSQQRQKLHSSSSLSTSATAPASETTTAAAAAAAAAATNAPPRLADRSVPLTIFAFPSLEPRALEQWPAQHLHLPLRRDLLHLAVVYEGDNTRQGTASSKTRYEVHGSHRKMRPQKGSGKARQGSRQSPLIAGGGKVFGPHPRDFGTELNRKMYDRAWRTALSYRYRRGELFVCQDGMELPLPRAFLELAQEGTLGRELEDGFVRRYVQTLLNGTADGNGSIGQAWGRAAGRTTFITTDHRPNLFTSLDVAGEDGRALTVDDVDVKDLLETGRLVVERSALVDMIESHRSDLDSRIYINGVRQVGPPVGRVEVE